MSLTFGLRDSLVKMGGEFDDVEEFNWCGGIVKLGNYGFECGEEELWSLIFLELVKPTLFDPNKW